MSTFTTAAQLAAADQGRPIRYRWKNLVETVRVGTLARHERDGATYVEVAPGHELLPAFRVELLPDDRIHEPGVHLDMPEATYHADPVPGGSLSSTMCKTLVQPGGPAKLQALLTAPREPKAAFDIGHAVHSLVLGVGAELALIPHDHWGSKEAKAAVQAARDAGKVPLKQADWDRVHAMADALTRHPHAASLLTDGNPEVSAFAQIDGLWLRARFDFLSATVPGRIVDFKTTVDASPDGFARDAAKYGYHIQRAHYLAVAQELGYADETTPFPFIAQEKTAPYLVSVFELDREFAAAGRALHKHALGLWRACRETGEWPGYPDQTVTIPAPPWLRGAPDIDGDDATQDLDPAFEAHLAALAGMEIS